MVDLERRPVATVRGLFRHPVKSMRGEALTNAALTWHGLEGDREFVFVKTGNITRFPWLTARDLPELVHYAAYLVDPENVRKSAVRVRTPAGQELAIHEDALRLELEERYGDALHLMRLSHGAPDGARLSVMGLASLRALGEGAGLELSPRRFRQNLWLEPANGEPFIEEQWIGRLLIVGEGDGAARVRLNRPDARCMIVNLDPDGPGQQPSVLREIVATRGNYVGVYASVERPGRVQIGDPVYLRGES